jgi:hypothetical protein
MHFWSAARSVSPSYFACAQSEAWDAVTEVSWVCAVCYYLLRDVLFVSDVLPVFADFCCNFICRKVSASFLPWLYNSLAAGPAIRRQGHQP